MTRPLNGVTSLAVQAFGDLERVRFLADRKERELYEALARDGIDLAHYVELTDRIVERYDGERERHGL